MPKALFISYYFPPCGAGWVMRITNFVRHLPQWGWKVAVLTVKEEYYKDNASPDISMLQGLPSDLLVVRTDSWEPKLKLKAVAPKSEFVADKKRPPLLTRLIEFLEKALFIPDVKILWLPVALRRGCQIIKSEGVDLIYVSVPDFSLLLIAYGLKRLTERALVLDLRDDWDENPYYRQKYWYGRKLVTCWERKIVAAADKVILVTQNSQKSYIRRYPHQPAGKFAFIPNGFDPRIESLMQNKPQIPADNFTIVHSGLLCPERVIPALFEAFRELIDEQPQFKRQARLVFLGNVCSYVHELVHKLGIGENVQCVGTLPYEENIRQVAQGALLLLIPSLNIPNSLPGKVYEYLAVRRPFLAITEDNVTRDFLAGLKHPYIYYPDDKPGIKTAIRNFYQKFQAGELKDWPAVPGTEIYSRAKQSEQLAVIFNEVNKAN